jgi:hypothetical protein
LKNPVRSRDFQVSTLFFLKGGGRDFWAHWFFLERGLGSETFGCATHA